MEHRSPRCHGRRPSTSLLNQRFKTWMPGHRRAEATPFFKRLCPGMTTPSLLVGDVLRDAVSERPVLRQDLDEVDEDVLGADAGILRQVLHDRAIERFLLVTAARVADGELDQHQIVATRDAKIVLAVTEI